MPSRSAQSGRTDAGPGDLKAWLLMLKENRQKEQGGAQTEQMGKPEEEMATEHPLGAGHSFTFTGKWPCEVEVLLSTLPTRKLCLKG